MKLRTKILTFNERKAADLKQSVCRLFYIMLGMSIVYFTKIFKVLPFTFTM